MDLEARREKDRPRRSRWLTTAVVVCAGAASILASWQRWINPFVDNAREMIVPARLADGQRLYKDVMYHYGPAAPWANAIAIKLFGRAFATLQFVGLAISGLLFWSIVRLVRRGGSELSAAAGAALAAALCMGAPNGGSFLFPYSFDTLLALAAAFFALERLSGSASRLRDTAGVAGLAVALASKPEIGAAAALVLLVSAARSSRWRPDLLRHGGIVLVAGALAGAAYAVAFRGLTWEISCCEGPLSLFSPPREWRNVFRVASGFADPGGSVARLLTALFLDLILLTAVGLITTAGRRLARPYWLPTAIEILWFSAIAAGVAFLVTAGAAIESRLPPLLLPMPIVTLAAAALELRRPLDEAGRSRFLLFALSGLFATRVLIGLAYGSYTIPYSILALPGLCATAAILILDRLSLRFADPHRYRRGAAALFAALALVGILRLGGQQRNWKLLHTAAGGLRLRPDKADAVAKTLEYLRARANPSDGLVGFPESGFFHFVARLRNPLRQDTFYPAILDARGEERVVDRLQRDPPRFVLLINQPAPGFGAGVFGQDYAVPIWAAIERAYSPVAFFGSGDPAAFIGDGPFFIRVYEKRR